MKDFLSKVHDEKIDKSHVRWKKSPDDLDFFNEVITKLKELNVKNLLDLACGDGNLIKKCRYSNIEAYGIDPLDNKDSNIYQGTFSSVIDNQGFLKDVKIDCISITNTLHGKNHVEDELQKIFDFLKKYSKYIIISHPFGFDYLLEGLTLKHEFKPSHGGKTVFHKLYKVN